MPVQQRTVVELRVVEIACAYIAEQNVPGAKSSRWGIERGFKHSGSLTKIGAIGVSLVRILVFPELDMG